MRKGCSILLVLLFLVSTGLLGCGGSGSGSGSRGTGSDPGNSGGSNNPSTNTVPKFAYITNQNGSEIFGYSVATVTGSLTTLPGFPVQTGLHPYAIAVDPQNRFAYVTDEANMLHVYLINQTSGMLTEVAGSPYAAGDKPSSVAVHPSGKYVYVGDDVGTKLFVFSVASTGVLTPVSGSPFTTADSVRRITLHPGGKFLFAAGGQHLQALAIDTNTGAITTINNVDCWDARMAADPAGAYLYAVSPQTYNVGVVVFSVNSSTGSLTLKNTLAATAGNSYLVVDPSGRFAQEVQQNFVWSFTIHDGVFTPVNPGVFPSNRLDSPNGLFMDPSGKFVYGLQSLNFPVQVFKLDTATGSIANVSQLQLPSGSDPHSMAFVTQ